jgi:predicted enzyme related to lactoylglutathione lyase
MAGQVVHLEIPSKDTEKSRAFWSGLFGWTFEQVPGPTEYHMTRISEATGAAISADPRQSGTRVYFDVDDINAGAARVRELGGEADEPMAVPNMGWFAVCKDAEKNEFGLWQTDPSAPAPSAT